MCNKPKTMTFLYVRGCMLVWKICISSSKFGWRISAHGFPSCSTHVFPTWSSTQLLCNIYHIAECSTRWPFHLYHILQPHDRYCIVACCLLFTNESLFFKDTGSQAKGYLGTRAWTGGSWEDKCTSLLCHWCFGTGRDPNRGLQRCLYQQRGPSDWVSWE